MFNKNKILSARFPVQDAKLLCQICKARGEDLSDFIRRAVRKELARMSYLTTDEKKALEITKDKNENTARGGIGNNESQ